MNEIKILPNKEINSSGSISKKFIELGIDDFHHACRWVKNLPYGYNSNGTDYRRITLHNKYLNVARLA